MARSPNLEEAPTNRLKLEDVVRVRKFKPVWVRCEKCRELAYMKEMWPERKGQCKCLVCGAIYTLPLVGNDATRYPRMPLWLKANFKGHVFWALNGEHLDYLGRIIQAELRERPVSQFVRGGAQERFVTNQNMPFNLPSWILSAKNRPDLLRLIRPLRKTVPQNLSHPPKAGHTG